MPVVASQTKKGRLLTPSQVKQMKKLYESGVPQVTIARQFGISRQLVFYYTRVKNGPSQI